MLNRIVPQRRWIGEAGERRKVMYGCVISELDRGARRAYVLAQQLIIRTGSSGQTVSARFVREGW
jgi:hypothetical protein